MIKEQLQKKQSQLQKLTAKIPRFSNSSKNTNKSLNTTGNKSPNLFVYFQRLIKFTFFESHNEPINVVSKYIIWCIQLTFLIVIGLNIYINRKIEDQNLSIQVLESGLLSRTNLFNETRELSKQVNIYKSIEQDRVLFRTGVKELFDTFRSENVEVGAVAFTKTKSNNSNYLATMTITSDDALRTALLLDKLTKLTSVSEIILKSASLSPASNRFVVNLELYLK